MVHAAEECARTLWRQYFISFFASLPFFVQGVGGAVLAAPAPAGPVIESVGVPWSGVASTASSLLAAPLCALLINRYGRKVGLFAVAALQAVTCVPLLLSNAGVGAEVGAEVSAVVAAAAAGAASGALFLAAPVYVREVSAVGAVGAAGARGPALSLMAPMTSAGNAVRLLLSTEHMVYLMLAAVAVESLAMFYIPETPAFYVIVDKLQDASGSVARLLRLQREDPLVCSETRRLQRESERARAAGAPALRALVENKVYRDEMKLGIALSTTAVLSGCIMFLDQDKVLAQLEAGARPGEMLVPSSLLAGGAACVALIALLEPKYLLSAAYSAMVLSAGTLAVYTQTDLTVTSLQWVPVAALPVLVFSYGIVWSMPTILLAEILNLEVRAAGMAAAWSCAQAARLAHSLAQPRLERAVGVYALLYLFAGVDMFGAVYAACALPDLRGRSVAQVERQMRRPSLF